MGIAQLIILISPKVNEADSKGASRSSTDEDWTVVDVRIYSISVK